MGRGAPYGEPEAWHLQAPRRPPPPQEEQHLCHSHLSRSEQEVLHLHREPTCSGPGVSDLPLYKTLPSSNCLYVLRKYASLQPLNWNWVRAPSQMPGGILLNRP